MEQLTQHPTAIQETQPNGDVEPALELAMQELEALEAPFWATAAGVVTGAGAASVVSYIGVTIAT